MSCDGVQVNGNKVTWEKWHIRTSFNYREGLVLHDVGCATLTHLPYEGSGLLQRAGSDIQPLQSQITPVY